MKEILKDIDIKGVIQVGANIGQELDMFIDLGIREILLFEPNPDSIGALTTVINNIPKSKYDSLLLVDKACGNFNGASTLHVASNYGMSSSLLKPKIHLEQYPGVRFPKKTIVDIVRLDDYVKEKEKYDFLSIDVQGFELEVLKEQKNYYIIILKQYKPK